jgi:hypothetical protein
MPRGAYIFHPLPGQTLVGTMLLASMSLVPILAQDAGDVRRFEITLENGRLAGGPRTLQAVRGERVELLWISDRTVTLYLHGYDIEVTVDAGSPQRMTFTARATGRFPVEVHGGSGRDRTLIHVEVHPR